MSQFNLGAALKDYKENSELTLLDNDSTHTVEITVAKPGSAPKGPKISLMGKVVGGPLAGSLVGLGTLSFSEKALWKTFPLLYGCGITDQFIQQADTGADPIKTIADALLGRVIEATVSVNEYNNEQRNRLEKAAIAGTTGAPVAPPAQSDPIQAQDFLPPQPQAPAPPAPGVAHTPTF